MRWKLQEFKGAMVTDVNRYLSLRVGQPLAAVQDGLMLWAIDGRALFRMIGNVLDSSTPVS